MPHVHSNPWRRGFTMIEVILSISLAGVVFAGAMSLLMLGARGQASMGDKREEITDSIIAQLVQRNAWDTLVLTPYGSTEERDRARSVVRSNETADEEDDEDVASTQSWLDDVPDEHFVDSSDRDLGFKPYRCLLENEWAATVEGLPEWANSVQRLEMALSGDPAAGVLGGFVGGLRADQLGESYIDPSAGVRYVFELRPDGSREAFMRSMGWRSRVPGATAPATYAFEDAAGTPDFGGAGGEDAEEAEGEADRPLITWSLWVRPVSVEELEQRRLGELPEPETHASRLAEAKHLIGGLTRMRWTIHRDRTDLPELRFRDVEDSPGYTDFFFQTRLGYAGEYRFELGWTVTEDVEEPEEDENGGSGSSGSDTGDAGDDTGNDAGNGRQGSGTRGGRGGNPSRGREGGPGRVGGNAGGATGQRGGGG